MFAYVSVLNHPFFAVTDTNGYYRLPEGFPAGDYVVGAAHLKAGEVREHPVSLLAGKHRTLNFEFTVPSTTQPQGRVVTSN